MLIALTNNILPNNLVKKTSGLPLDSQTALKSPLAFDTISFGKTTSNVEVDKVGVINDFLSYIYNNWQNAKPLPSYDITEQYYKQYAIELSGQTYLFKNCYKPQNEFFIIENLTTGAKISQFSIDLSRLLKVQYSSKKSDFSVIGPPKKDDAINSLKSMLEIIYVITLQTNQGIDPKRIEAFLKVISPNPFKK